MPAAATGAETTRHRAAGFTLLEVLAVVLLTSIVVGSVLNHYVNLSRATERATSQTGAVRRAVALLDRVGRDLESAVLVQKPEELDPLLHPWRFQGTTKQDTSGADQLKFVTRGRIPHDDGRESDLEVVVYTLQHGEEDDAYDLLRWASPRLQTALDEELPSGEDDGAMLLAEGLSDFGVTFIDDTGAASDEWDSTQLARSNTLPAAVQIHVAFADTAAPLVEAELDPDERRGYSRTVVLPVRELDFEELLDPASLVSGGPGNEEEIAEGKTNEEMDTDQCLDGPCGRMTACQAINCSAELGLHGESVDLALQKTMQDNLSFCTWRAGFSTLHRLIDNPACRP